MIDSFCSAGVSPVVLFLLPEQKAFLGKRPFDGATTFA